MYWNDVSSNTASWVSGAVGPMIRQIGNVAGNDQMMAEWPPRIIVQFSPRCGNVFVVQCLPSLMNIQPQAGVGCNSIQVRHWHELRTSWTKSMVGADVCCIFRECIHIVNFKEKPYVSIAPKIKYVATQFLVLTGNENGNGYCEPVDYFAVHF